MQRAEAPSELRPEVVNTGVRPANLKSPTDFSWGLFWEVALSTEGDNVKLEGWMILPD